MACQPATFHPQYHSSEAGVYGGQLHVGNTTHAVTMASNTPLLPGASEVYAMEAASADAVGIYGPVWRACPGTVRSLGACWSPSNAHLPACMGYTRDPLQPTRGDKALAAALCCVTLAAVAVALSPKNTH